MIVHKCSQVPGLLEVLRGDVESTRYIKNEVVVSETYDERRRRSRSLELNCVGVAEAIYNEVYSETYNDKKDTRFRRIHYDKETLSHGLAPLYRICRSIWTNQKREVVCIAPPQNLSAELFIRTYPIDQHDIWTQTYVEGLMVNMFWDAERAVWAISPNPGVNRTTAFFATMEHPECFNPACCYSFVFQHPDMDSVAPFVVPRLYLVAVFEIKKAAGDVHIYEANLHDVVQQGEWSNTNIHFPRMHKVATSYSEIIDIYGSMNTDYQTMGVILWNTATGEKCKIRNPVFESVSQDLIPDGKIDIKNNLKTASEYLSLRQSGGSAIPWENTRRRRRPFLTTGTASTFSPRRFS